MDILNFLIDNILYIALIAIVVFIFIGLLIANFSFDKYLSGENKYRKIGTEFWGSTFEFANYLSEQKFLNQIFIKVLSKDEHRTNGFYSPSNQTIGIAEKLANENSVAGIATIAHEFGHAKQHFSNPKILIKNAKLSKFVEYLGALNFLLLFAIIIFAIFNILELTIICFALIILNFVIAIILKFSTLKIEKNASKLAIDLLIATNIFSKKDMKNIKSFLKLAKNTYVGDLFCALFAWTGLVRKTNFFEK